MQSETGEVSTVNPQRIAPFDLELRPMDTKPKRVGLHEPPDLSMLNPEQSEAMDSMLKVLSDQSEFDHILLTGPAGTGKTFVIQKLIHKILHSNPDFRIAMAAPTQKAVGVTRTMSPFQNNQVEFGYEAKDNKQIEYNKVNYLTVHKLLELVPKIDEHGNETYVPSPKIVEGNEVIRKFDLVFVDEVSMCDGQGSGQGLLAKLMKWKDVVTFVFIGDDEQLPPVDGVGIGSPIFVPKYRQRNKIGLAALRTVMRQALDNPVLAMATEMRLNKTYQRHNAETPSGRVLFLPVNTKKVFSKKEKALFDLWDMDLDRVIMHLFGSKEFRFSSDYCKILAYNRESVKNWNERVRAIMHRAKHGSMKLNRIEEGDKLILQSPYMEYNEIGERTVKYPNFSELHVQGYYIKEMTLPIPNGSGVSFKAFLAQIRFTDPNTGEDSLDTIRILHQDERENFKAFLGVWENACRATSKEAVDKKKATEIWGKYYGFKQYFAHFDYNFALTVHRSQGSSFQYVLVDENNIRQMQYNGGISQYKAVMYVALSRARYCNIMMGKGVQNG